MKPCPQCGDPMFCVESLKQDLCSSCRVLLDPMRCTFQKRCYRQATAMYGLCERHEAGNSEERFD